MADPPVTTPPGGAGSAEQKAGFIPPFAVVACGSVFFWQQSSRNLLYTLMPAIAEDLELSAFEALTVITAIVLGSNVGHWVAGWMPGSRKRRILYTTALSMPATAVIGAAEDLVGLLALGFVMGTVTGMYLPLGLAIITDAGGSSRKAMYVSVHEVLASVGSSSGAAFAAVALYQFGWRNSLAMSCAVGVTAALVFWRMREDDGRSTVAKQDAPLPLSRTLVYCCIAFSGSTILMGGLMASMPLIMVRGWGVDATVAASLIGYARISGLLSNVLAGLRADRWGHIRVLRGLQVLGLAGAVVMMMGAGSPLFTPGLLAVGVAAAGMVTVIPPAIASAFPAEQRVRALAVSVAVGGFVGSVGAPPLFGVLVDMGQPAAPMLLAVVIVAVALALTGRIPSEPSEVAAGPAAASPS